VSTAVINIPRTLIADDQPDVVSALRLLLKGAGYQTEAAHSPAAVLDALKHHEFDLVLMDLNYARDTTSGKEGLDLITSIHEFDSDLPIVVMTAWGTVDLAVESMRLGVQDFVQKPWENSRLLQKLGTFIEQGRVRREQHVREIESEKLQRQLSLELEEARKVQEGLLPRRMPKLPGFSLASAWQPAHTVSGDYLTAQRLDQDRVALCVADVSGKGLPAALLMSNMQAVLTALSAENISPAELCERLNAVMCANTPLQTFITCFYSLLDVQQRTLSFSNAGHNPPLLAHGSDHCLRLEDGGRVIGAFPDSRYVDQTIQLTSGDKLLIFTDGLTEARNSAGEEFGERRLIECLLKYSGRSAAELRANILSEVTRFCGNKFDDDAALIVVIAD
jgi:sigma-B regulation protein RsbU (phosphoserine phosphatase)